MYICNDEGRIRVVKVFEKLEDLWHFQEFLEALGEILGKMFSVILEKFFDIFGKMLNKLQKKF